MFLSVEPANFCNLHCPECPIGRAVNVNKRAVLPLELYDNVLSELSSTLHTVMLFFQGEPLLSGDLCEMIVRAKRHKLYVVVSTNAQILTSELAKKIVQSGLDKIIVSVDGLSQESYEQYRIGGSLQKVLDGIAYLQMWKKRLGLKTLCIELQCLRLKSNEHEWALFKERYKSLGADKLVFKTAQFYGFEHGNSLMPTNSKYARYKQGNNGLWQLKTKLHDRCFRLWAGAVIDVQGNVRPCCFDKNADHIFGNITQESFINVWRSARANSFRKAVLRSRKSIEICQNCTTP